MANQIIIDIGAAANDGTGDPLRTAFNYVNNNFSNVWNTGLPESNVVFSGNRILTANTNGNLVLAPNGTGRVVANVDIQPNANNTLNLGSLTRQWNTVYTRNISISGELTSGDLTVNGNLTVSGDIIEVGNIVTDSKTIQLANTAANASSANGSGVTVGANDDIATLLYNSTTNTWNTNIGVSATGNISAPYFIGNGALLTGLETFGNIAFSGANIQLAANVANTNIYIAPSGSTSNAYIRIPDNASSLGNGLAVVNRYGHVRISAKDGAAIQTWYFREDGSFELPGGVPAHIKSDQDIIIQTGSGDYWTFGSDSVLTVPGSIVPDTSNAYSLGNATNQWSDLWVSNATIYMNSVPITLAAGNVLTVGDEAVLTNNSATTISTTGNVTADYFFGNASQLSGLATVAFSGNYSDLAGTPVIPTATSNLINDSGFITAATANVISVNGQTGVVSLTIPTATSNLTNDSGFITAANLGTLTTDVSTTGNVTASYILGNGSQLTGLPASYTDSNVTTLLSSLGANTISATANITTTANVSGGNIIGTLVAPATTANTYVLYNDSGVIGGSGVFTFDESGNVLTIGTTGGQLRVADISTPQAGVNLRFIPSSGTTLSYGHLNPQFANTYDLGSSSSRWNNMFANVANVSTLTSTGSITGANVFATNITLSGTGTAVNASGGNILTNQVTGTQFNFLSGLYTVNLNASGATANYTINLPANAGSNGQVLTTNGSGALSWATPASTYGNANVATFLANYGSNTISTTGNITAGNLVGNISITGNVTGTSSNVNLVAGSYTWTFDNTGQLTVPAVGGSEGGQIDLAQSANSTLDGNAVSVDSYLDQVRIFENGGNSRGVYIDLTQAANGVGTLLNNRVSGIVNAGTFVTMDNLKATVTTTGNRGLGLATVSGTVTGYVSGSYTLISGGPGGSAASVSLTTSVSTSILGQNFSGEGDTAIYVLRDNTNSRVYRITMMIGGSYNNNFISIERLL